MVQIVVIDLDRLDFIYAGQVIVVLITLSITSQAEDDRVAWHQPVGQA